MRSALYRSGCLGLSRRLHRKSFAGATVLLYHHVVPSSRPETHHARLLGDPTGEQLDRLIGYLKRSFKFITPNEAVERWDRGDELDPFSLMLTFDDGYLDLHTTLLPILRKHRVRATVFLATGPINREVGWFQLLFASIAYSPLKELPAMLGLNPMPLVTAQDRVAAIEEISRLQLRVSSEYWEDAIRRLSQSVEWDGQLRDEEMMSWDHVKELHDSGWVEIGGHTVTHPLLAACGPERLRGELNGAFTEIRERLGLEQIPFAYPNGRASNEAARMVKEAGFNCAFTGRPAKNTSKTERFELGRIYLGPSDLAEAALTLSGLRPMGGRHANESAIIPSSKLGGCAAEPAV